MARPALVITAKRLKPVPAQYLEAGVGVITLPDLRWKRCDIKTIALLPNVLGKQRAAEEGAYEAWQIDPEGNVTEGTSTNAWIVTKDRKIVTRPLGHEICPASRERRCSNFCSQQTSPWRSAASPWKKLWLRRKRS